ncbi:hypothetical protein [Mucilaginibacter sp. dw_454]|uniref:hypothetical protein n=1 Tax=Mucilaginibacter sp. dw_454 TaxID=2720079 RepID=UPI001BD5DAC7|nr:hypothetical protein [Mucilaginibacter sp. dw_454]
MKRLIVITTLLVLATAGITVVYFRNLNTPGLHTTQTMRTIPDNAALVFEFNNDDSFYDIFNGNKLFAAVIGHEQLGELDTLHDQLFKDPVLQKFFNGQNAFISLHPMADKSIGLLITTAAIKNFNPDDIDQLTVKTNKGLVVTPTTFNGKKGYVIYSSILKKRFYLLNKEDGIYTGSFSKDLIELSAKYIAPKDNKAFMALPEQQNTNSLANLYINYHNLNPFFAVLFNNQNTDIFKCFKLFPALAALNLNFKSDALLFTGFSNIETDQPTSYLNLFTNQQPVANNLKDIFPSTTAYSICFSMSDPIKFKSDLSAWYTKAKMQTEKDSIFARIKSETGVNLITEFNQSLGQEFAVVTTKYMEKYAIVSLKDGSAFKPIMKNISTMTTDEIGQVNYRKLPFFLLGDAFSLFNRPWFMVVDNYLVLANSQSELSSYHDYYFNQKLQSKSKQYNQFADLLAERSNVSWYINFKNAQPILERDLADDFYHDFKTDETGWKNFYGASYQLISSNKNFYTSFCMSLNQPDSVATKTVK